MRPGYGSRCTATSRPCAFAAAITAGSRWSSIEPHPHHELTTSSTPVAAISAIWRSSTARLELEYGPRIG